MPVKPFTANTGTGKKIFLLKPRGFCAGVVRAIDVVKIALNLYGPPVYVRKEIVHNKHVVEELRSAGAVFVEEWTRCPGRPRDFQRARCFARSAAAGKERSLQVIDATCPLVTKVHLEAIKFARSGYTIVLIGHKDHDEVIGTLGEAPDALSWCRRSKMWSTASAGSRTRGISDPDHAEPGRDARHRDAAEGAFPDDPGSSGAGHLLRHGEPADGRESRGRACDLLLVVGSQNSSNSKRLVEVCENPGCAAYPGGRS